MVYHKYAKMESDEELGGNISTPQSKDVLRKLKCEQMSDANIHTYQCISGDKHFETGLVRYTVSGGFVQKYSLKPMQIHMYCTYQLDLYLKLAKRHQGVLYLDATSALLTQLPGCETVYLYYLVVQNPIKSNMPISVAEMLSDDQHLSECKTFLDRWCNSLKYIYIDCLPA